MSIGFKRSTSGINNQHMFYNVDYIVFLEGGTVSYTKEDAYQGKFTPDTEDSIYWTKIFETFTGNKKIKYKSIGSKAVIEEIAKDIIEGKLTTCYAAMDCEFDQAFNQKMIHPRVFYTNGYSWENDVWNTKVIKRVIEQLSGSKIKHKDIESIFDLFLKTIKIGVYADGYLFRKKSSFFPRKSGLLFCIDCTPVDLPNTKKEQIEILLTSKGCKKSTLYSFAKRHKISVIRHCFGHLLADFSCLLIRSYLKNRHTLKAPSNNLLSRMALWEYFENHFPNSKLYNYYHNQFSAN